MSPSISGIYYIWSFIFWGKIRAYQVVDCPVGSNFCTKWKISDWCSKCISKNIPDCQKPFGSKMLRGKNRAYQVVRFVTAQKALFLSPINTTIMWAFISFSFAQFCDCEFLKKTLNFMGHPVQVTFLSCSPPLQYFVFCISYSTIYVFE